MRIRTTIVALACLVFFTGFVLFAYAQEVKPIKLPEPKIDQAKSLVQALKDRKSSREFGAGTLPLQTLSNLLWAGFGINRPDSGRRTAPSAKNWQEIEVYVATAQGMYLYDAKGNTLVPVVSGDVRALCGVQPFVKDVAVNLVYVADMKKTEEVKGLDTTALTFADTGFIAQNVYLYCAAEGLPAVFRVLIDRQKLGEAMKLRPDQKIVASQSVGLPKSGK